MEQRSTQHQLDKQKKNDWFLRFIKGMFIGQDLSSQVSAVVHLLLSLDFMNA